MIRCTPSCRRVGLLVFLHLVAGCVGCGVRPAREAGLERMTRTELYFGRSMPGGAVVSEPAWRRFLERTVTPRFKDGLTVLDADGQYLTSSGTLVREKSKVVVLIHPDTPAARRAIREIIAEYKRAFRQESVLRVTAPARVSF